MKPGQEAARARLAAMYPETIAAIDSREFNADAAADERAESRHDAGGFRTAEQQTTTGYSTPSARIIPTRSRSGLSNRGKLAADREPDTIHDPAYQDPIPLAEDEKTVGLRAIERIRNQRNRGK